VAIAAIALLAVTQSQPPIYIGLVREDGYLIPIATITPKLFETIAMETTVNGEPLPPEEPEWPFSNLEWTLSSSGGTASVAIKTLEPLTVDSHCTDQTVWRTTLKLPPARKNVAPIQKIGLAVNGSSVQHPENVAGQPDAASRRVARVIVQLTHAKEAERLATEPKEYWPSNSYSDRAQVPVRLEKLQRHSNGGSSTYYFEATKPWLRGSPENGLVTGWLSASGTDIKSHDVKYKFNDDGHKENDRAIVWGIVPYRGRTLWILEWHGYEHEYYTVHDWPSAVERVKIDGGGC